MSLPSRWTHHLTRLRAEGRHRTLTPPAGLDLSSNDYLGFANMPFPSWEGDANLSHSGAASRLLRGHHPIWDEVETLLAHWHLADAALMFTSGYAANEGLLSTVIEPDDVAFSDQANHASLIDGLRLSKARRIIFRHNDLAHLEESLQAARCKRSAQQQFFIVTESLFGMDGDRAPLVEMAALAERFEACLIVDEAHATGCFGPMGQGLVEELGLRSRVLATMHTGGKALGVPGAYVCGRDPLKEYLVNRCRHLIFTTALPPLLAAWWIPAIRRVQGARPLRERLHRNAHLFRAALTSTGLTAGGANYIVPILIGDDSAAVRAAHSLQQGGYDIRAIRPPTVPPGTARLRVSIHADHAEEVLTQVARDIAALPTQSPPPG